MNGRCLLQTVVCIISVFLDSSAGDPFWTFTENTTFCFWAKPVSNGHTHYMFLHKSRKAGERSLVLFDSVWSKENSLVDCIKSVDPAVTKSYVSKCWKTGDKPFSETPDGRFNISTLVEPAGPCVDVGHLARRQRAMRRSRDLESVDRKVVSMWPDSGESSALKLRRSKRAWMIPGTLWCGAGNKALNFTDLGMFEETDKCCREHDHCKDSIASFGFNYGIFNTNIFTLSHCDCDSKFRHCLHNTNESMSDVVGYGYFNVLKMRCFEFSHRMQCAQWTWWGMCRFQQMTKYALLKDATYFNSTFLKFPEEDTLDLNIHTMSVGDLTITTGSSTMFTEDAKTMSITDSEARLMSGATNASEEPEQHGETTHLQTDSPQTSTNPPHTATKDSPQTSTNDSPKTLTNDSPQTSTNDSPKTPTNDSAKTSTNDSPKTTTNDSAKTSTNDSPKTTTNDSPKTLTNDSPKTPTNDSPKTLTNDSPQTSTNDSPKTTTNDSPKTLTNDSPQTPTNDSPQTTTNDSPQTSTNDSPQTSTNDSPHTSTNDSPQTSTNDSPKTSTNDSPKTSTNDSPQTSTNDSPKTLTHDSPKTPTNNSPHTPTEDSPQTSTDPLRTPTNDSPQTPTNDSPQTPTKDSSQTSTDPPQTSTNNSPKTSTNDSPKTSTNDSPKTSTNDSPKTSTNDSPKTSTNDSPQTPTNDSPQTPTNDSPQTPTNDSPPTSTDPPKTPTNDSPKTPTNDSPKTPTNDSPETPTNNSPHTQTKDSPQTSSDPLRTPTNDSPQTPTNDSPQSSADPPKAPTNNLSQTTDPPKSQTNPPQTSTKESPQTSTDPLKTPTNDSPQSSADPPKTPTNDLPQTTNPLQTPTNDSPQTQMTVLPQTPTTYLPKTQSSRLPKMQFQPKLHTRQKGKLETCESYKDLDSCRYQIPALQEKYGLHNTEFTTLYHCNCTTRLAREFAKMDVVEVHFLLLDFVSQSCFTLPLNCTEGNSCTISSTEATLIKHWSKDMAGRRPLVASKRKAKRFNSKRRYFFLFRLYKKCLRMYSKFLNRKTPTEKLQGHFTAASQ